MMLIDAEEVQRVDEVTAETAYVLARMITAQKRMIAIYEAAILRAMENDEYILDKRSENAHTAALMLDKHITELVNKIVSVYDAEGACTNEEYFCDVIDDYANFNFAHLDVSDDDFDYSADDDFDYLLDEDSDDDVDDDGDVNDVWLDTHNDKSLAGITFDDFI